MKRDVFISYPSDRTDEAKALCAVLKKNNISCWMAPDDIPKHMDYSTAIPKAIGDCSVFLIIITKSANDSMWMPKELDIAVNLEKVIVPFVLEDCDICAALNFYLTNIEKYEAMVDKDAAVNKLIGDIKRIISIPFYKKLQPWLDGGPYKKLNDKEEFLAMNVITIFSCCFAILTFFQYEKRGVIFPVSLLFSLITLDLIWYIGGALVPRIARNDNKFMICVTSLLTTLLLGMFFCLIGLIIVALIGQFLPIL